MSTPGSRRPCEALTLARWREMSTEQCERLARSQHGAWSRRQAFDAGASESLIDRRLRSGAWLRLDAGVYGSPAAPPTWHRSVIAAVLAEPWAVASHRSAAVLHGLEGFRPGRPEVTILPGANARGRLAIAHRGVDTRASRGRRDPVRDAGSGVRRPRSGRIGEAGSGRPLRAPPIEARTLLDARARSLLRARATWRSGPPHPAHRARRVRCGFARRRIRAGAAHATAVRAADGPAHPLASAVSRARSGCAARRRAHRGVADRARRGWARAGTRGSMTSNATAGVTRSRPRPAT